MPLLIPDLLWAGGRFEADRAVRYDRPSGRITAVGAASSLREAATAEGDVVRRLGGVALMPGFVNAHSHAFQRLIRGRTQWRPADRAASDFWSWREAMYGAALRLSPDDVHAVARQAFMEMLRAGYTAVGEFHYLHRDPAGLPYDDPNELAYRVVEAAREVGLRITLLNVCYAAGGIDRPLEPAQRRFATPDLDAFLAETEALGRRYADDPLVQVGVAPHSVRAVPRDWLGPMAVWAGAQGVACHMHVSEQPAEVEAAQAAWGRRPVQLLADEGVLGPFFTAVHATHIEPDELQLLAGSQATVCACPTTERDLGDGVLRAAALLQAGVALAVGSDSQSRIDPFEELRLLEYHERLRRLGRVVLTGSAAAGEQAGKRLRVGPALLDVATAGGARSLGAGAGAVARDQPADLLAIDLEHPDLAGWTPDTLPALLALHVGPEVVRDVWVGGVPQVQGRHHPQEEGTLRAFRTTAERIPPQ